MSGNGGNGALSENGRNGGTHGVVLPMQQKCISSVFSEGCKDFIPYLSKIINEIFGPEGNSCVSSATDHAAEMWRR